jgi:hypothetical protein
MGLLGVARANTAVGVSPETFLLLLLQLTGTTTMLLHFRVRDIPALQPEPGGVQHKQS